MMTRAQTERPHAGFEETPGRASGPGAEAGFTLIETSIALLILLIVGLGIASAFTTAIYNNSGGNDRTQSLAIAQQALERLRNADFTSTGTDPILAPGTITQGVRRGGRPYTLVSTVVDTSPTLKTITIRVSPRGAGPQWSTGAAGVVEIVTQRARIGFGGAAAPAPAPGPGPPGPPGPPGGKKK